MARAISKIQVSDPGPSWPSCLLFLEHVIFIFIESGCAPIDTSDDINLVMSLHPKFDDAVITFQCEDDYLMFGQPEIHCNGVQWSSAPPRCEGKPFITGRGSVVKCSTRNSGFLGLGFSWQCPWASQFRVQA